MPFTCAICEEESTRICIACTKDSCENHLCEKCGRCSDCCGCEVTLNEATLNGIGSKASVAESLATSAENGPSDEPEKNFAGGSGA
jgi:hypothetical protein